MNYLKVPVFIPINGKRIMHTNTMTLDTLLMVEYQQNKAKMLNKCRKRIR
tara:strand:- start:26041 stop:26190 length:150 start_codon:yes stop_codon:yes gene_type:complete